MKEKIVLEGRTIVQFADYLKVGVSTVRKWIAKDKLVIREYVNGEEFGRGGDEPLLTLILDEDRPPDLGVTVKTPAKKPEKPAKPKAEKKTAKPAPEVEPARKTGPGSAVSKVRMFKFSATWCGPCKAMHPIIEKFKAAHPGVEVTEFDVDKDKDKANTYDVGTVPTMLFVDKRGDELTGQEGACNLKRLEELLEEAESKI